MNRLIRVLDALFDPIPLYQVRAFDGGFIPVVKGEFRVSAIRADGSEHFLDGRDGLAVRPEPDEICADMEEARRRIDAHKRFTGVIVEWEGR